MNKPKLTRQQILDALKIVEETSFSRASELTRIPIATLKRWSRQEKKTGDVGIPKGQNGSTGIKKKRVKNDTIHDTGKVIPKNDTDPHSKTEPRQQHVNVMESLPEHARKIDAALSPMRKLFVQEYLVDLNATQAAIRAGYSPRTAYAQGNRLLKDPEVRAEIDKAMELRALRTGITADRVLEEIGKIAFCKLGDYVKFGKAGVEIKESEDVDTAVLAEVSETITVAGGSKKIKLHDKMKALELAGRHLGMFKDGIDQPREIKIVFGIPRPPKGKVVLPDEVETEVTV